MGDMRLLGVGKLHDESVNGRWKAYFEKGGQKPPWALRWDSGKLWAGDQELFKALHPARKAAIVQGLRALPYVSLGVFVSRLLMRLYGFSTTAMGEAMDPRLRDVGLRLKEYTQKKEWERKRSISGAPDTDGRGTSQPIESRSNNGQIERSQKRQEITERNVNDRDSYDDASPTNGDDFFGEVGTAQRPRPMSPNEANLQHRGGFQTTTKVDPFDLPERQGGFQQERYERQAPSSENSFDSASPTGGAGAVADEDGNSGGSAWDRIRQGSASGASPSNLDENTRSLTGQPEKNDDSGFAFSSSEEEKTYARVEAQKEFDARVEKERDGGDFDSGKKW